MYISKVIVHNFQSHKHTEVSLSRGLNIFVGQNDQGKTALAKRAIQWCLFNEPQGNDFVRYKEKPNKTSTGEPEREDLCYVKIIFDNGIELTRKREKNKNYYQLIDENGEIHNFESFGSSVPELIQKTLGISKLKIDDDIELNLNIIGAKDLSLIYESNNYKSKVIGAFAGTNVIDVAIRGIQADMKNISAEIKSLEKDIEEINKEIENMGDMKKKEKIVQKIDDLYFSLSEENYILEELFKLNEKIKERQNCIKQDKKIIENYKDVEKEEKQLLEFENLIAEVKKLIDIRNRLVFISNRISERKKIIEDAKEIIKKYKDIEKDEIEITKKELEIIRIQNKINEINNIRRTLINLYCRIQSKKEFIKEALKIIEKYKNIDAEEEKLVDIENQLNDIYSTISKTIEIRNRLIDINAEIKERKKICTQGKAYIEQKDKEIAELIESCVEDIIKLGKCPTCMSNLDSSHIERIKKELINL